MYNITGSRKRMWFNINIYYGGRTDDGRNIYKKMGGRVDIWNTDCVLYGNEYVYPHREKI